MIPYGENFTDDAPDFYHTPETGDDLIASQVARYILDFADSVEHAITIFNEKDIDPIYECMEEFHWIKKKEPNGSF